MGIMLSGHTPAKTIHAQDFWLLYASDGGRRVLGDVLHALYYLPDNFKLLVVTKSTEDQMALTAETELIGRVQYETEAGLSKQTSPFSKAKAVISAETPAGSDKPTLIIAGTQAGMERNEWNGFTIGAGHPEALASAILRIARTESRLH